MAAWPAILLSARVAVCAPVAAAAAPRVLLLVPDPAIDALDAARLERAIALYVPAANQVYVPTPLAADSDAIDSAAISLGEAMRVDFVVWFVVDDASVVMRVAEIARAAVQRVVVPLEPQAPGNRYRTLALKLAGALVRHPARRLPASGPASLSAKEPSPAQEETPSWRVGFRLGAEGGWWDRDAPPAWAFTLTAMLARDPLRLVAMLGSGPTQRRRSGAGTLRLWPSEIMIAIEAFHPVGSTLEASWVLGLGASAVHAMAHDDASDADQARWIVLPTVRTGPQLSWAPFDDVAIVLFAGADLRSHTTRFLLRNENVAALQWWWPTLGLSLAWH